MNNEKRIITLQATGSLDCEKKKEKKMIKNDVVWSTLFKFVVVFYKQCSICHNCMNVGKIYWMKIHIIYINENADDFLLNRFNKKLLKE